MYPGRVLAPILVWALVLGSLTLPAIAEEGDCEEHEVWDEQTQSCVEDEGETPGDPEIVDEWTECRDDGKYNVRKYDNGSQEEERVGECDEWVTDSWCDDDERVENWRDEAGGEWQERYYDPACADSSDGSSWQVGSWCEDGERVEEWEDESGGRWQERRYDQECEAGDNDDYDDHREDPYGCQQGESWDHYLARCVSEEASRLMDRFWECTDQAHRRVAAEQKEADIRARETRQERRSLEEEAMQHERAGRWDEAERIWDKLRQLDWEEQRHWHELEKRIADAQEACIQEYSQKAREIRADYLIEEFEAHRFDAAPEPEPEPMHDEPPGDHRGPGCGPTKEPYQDDRYDDRFDDRHNDRFDDRHDERRFDERHRDEPYRDDHRGPGEGDCGPGPMMEEGFGLPPEAQEAVREAMAWCEERMWEIDSERFKAESFEESQALEERVRQVERECREKMEAIFREYDRGHRDEFDEHFGGFTMTESGSDVEVLGRNLLFTGKPEQSLIEDFSCQGVPVLESVRPYFTMEDVWPTSEHKLAFFDHFIESGRNPDPSQMEEHERDAFMVVHDDPHCTIKISPERATSADQPEVKLVFPSLYSCSREDGHIMCADDGETEILVRVHGEQPVRVDDRTLIVSGAVTLRLTGGSGDYRALERFNKDERFDGSAAVSFKEDELVAQSVSVGDLQMDVRSSDDGEGLKVTLDKASHVGSYVVLTLDAVDSCSVKISGWAVTDDRRETLEMRAATDLVDALDTDYDGDWAKYYTVKDEHGCQLIITNSHYSVKEFVVHPVEEGGLMSFLPGPGIVITAMLIMAGAAVVRRRSR